MNNLYDHIRGERKKKKPWEKKSGLESLKWRA